MSRGEGGSASGASERCSAGGHRFSVFQALSPLELFYTVEPQSVVLLFSGRASLCPSRQAPNRPLPTPAASASLCRCRGSWTARWQKRKPRRFLAAAIGMGVGVWRQRKKRRGIAGLFRGFVAPLFLPVISGSVSTFTAPSPGASLSLRARGTSNVASSDQLSRSRPRWNGENEPPIPITHLFFPLSP